MTLPLVDRLDPRARLLAAIFLTLGIVAARSFPPLVLALCGAAALAAVAGLDLATTLRRLLALEGFLAAALALLPFTHPGTPLFAVAGFPASAEGLRLTGLILLKANATALTVAALAGTMPLPRFGQALAGLGLPEKLVQMFLFTVRYLDLIQAEYHRLRTAMRARAFVMGTRPHCWVSLGHLFGMLTVRSLDRSDRILAAMRLRGFAGRFPTLETPARPGAADITAVVAAILLALCGAGLGG